MILKFQVEVAERVFSALGATNNRSIIHKPPSIYQHPIEEERMLRRHIEVAVRYIRGERRATNLDGSHIVRPILMGFALGRPTDDSLDGPQFSGNCGD